MGIFNSLIAYVSNAMSLSTSTGYERALSEIHLLATQKCGRFFSIVFYLRWRASPDACLTNLASYHHASGDARYQSGHFSKCFLHLKQNQQPFENAI